MNETPPHPEVQQSLIPVGERLPAMLSRLPGPVVRRAALGVALSAAGTFFLKRVAELVAEDAYRGLKRGLGRVTGWRGRREETPPVPDEMHPAPLPDETDTLLIRVASVRRVVWPGRGLAAVSWRVWRSDAVEDDRPADQP